MSIIDDARLDPFRGPRFTGAVLDLAVGGPTADSRASGARESRERSDADGTAADDPVLGGGAHGPERIAGFDTAIDMAEAANCGNIGWWNEIRSRADDPAVGEYAASVLLAELIRDSAHRLGVPTADVWSTLHRLGHLPR